MQNNLFKNVKKYLFITLLAVMCFFIPMFSINAEDKNDTEDTPIATVDEGISLAATGYSYDSPYMITIPASATLNTSTMKTSLNISGGIYNYHKLTITTSSANGYKLKAGSETLAYTLDKTSITKQASSSTTDFSETINVTASGTPKTAGAFKDTLTFTIKCEPVATTATFSNNDGTSTSQTLTLTPGKAFGTLPTVTRSGYKFNGWFYMDANANKVYITDTSIFDPSVTSSYYADWKKTESVLQTGSAFNANIPETATSVQFVSYRTVPSGTTTTDVSADQDGSILAWLEGTTMYVSPANENVKIFANQDCSNMFETYVSYMYPQTGTKATITSIVFDNFNTSKVTNMSYMFSKASSLVSLNLSNFNTSNVSKMNAMFSNCSGLTSLDLSGFDTSKVTSMSVMFSGCSSLTSLDLSSFNTNNVSSFASMFSSCSSLTSLDLLSFDTSKVVDTSYMFGFCSSLTTIYVSDLFTTDTITNSKNMFNYCSKLTGSEGTTYNSNYLDKTYAHVDGGTSNPGYFSCDPWYQEWDYTIDGNYVLLKIYNGTETAYTVPAKAIINGTTYTTEIGKGHNLNPGTITSLNFAKGVVANESLSCLFYHCEKLISLDLSNLDTSNATGMINMFDQCISLTSLNLSNLNTSNVTTMSYMFEYCISLTSLDLSSFDTSKVTSMYAMFDYCQNLKTIYVSDLFTTDKVTSSTNMFLSCKSIVGQSGATYNYSKIDASMANYTTGYLTYSGSRDEEIDDTDIINTVSLAKTYSSNDFTSNNEENIAITNMIEGGENTNEFIVYYHLNNDEDLNSLLAMNISSITINDVMTKDNLEYDNTKFKIEQSEDGVLTITSIMESEYPTIEEWKTLIYGDIFTDINENVVITLIIDNFDVENGITGYERVEINEAAEEITEESLEETAKNDFSEEAETKKEAETLEPSESSETSATPETGVPETEDSNAKESTETSPEIEEVSNPEAKTSNRVEISETKADVFDATESTEVETPVAEEPVSE